jgi:Tfp pilus assembly protein PilX
MFELVVTLGVLGATAVLGLLAGNRRAALESRRSAAGQRDSSLHRQRAQAQADVESRDIDDMLDAISEYRRRAGQRDVGEEIADEILRSTWDD